ncbi:site-specific recombinases [Candidatus Scalindua japonica]|uniref:Site-specific recombinases n=1 Tax=Candidatus Scalindua japonica TaxID=1284222 RepID=A0A286TXR1_9BACT|nr:hypothetical protein [Candidatus Scalindua japonica]GAX60685.1 site-specific recombinases [Candidatus Scalindua japonica]
MIRTIEATIDQKGRIKLSEPVKLPSSCRALVMILEEKPLIHVNEEAILSEEALAEDWNRPEEDEAWQHLQEAQ